MEDSGPSPAPRREKARTVAVIAVTGLLTLAVMGAVIAMGVQGREAAGRNQAYDYRDLYPPDGAGDAEPPPDDCPFDPEHPPRIRFDLPPNGLDFGPVKQGVKQEAEVVFRNEGGGPLCIRRVEAGCGCMKAKLVGDTRRFEQGEEGRIRVLLDTKGKEGLLKKTITVYTNAVDVPLKKFVAQCSVTLGLRLSSTFVNFGRVTAGKPSEVRIRLRAPKSESDWKVTEVVGTQEVEGHLVPYEWHVEEIPDPRDLVRELVIRHPGLTTEDTSFQDKILVKTTHPDRKEFTLRAHLLVVKPILAVPRRAVLGYVPSDLPPPRIKLIPGDVDVKFKVTGLELRAPDGAEPAPSGTGFEATQGEDPSGEPWVEVRYDGKSRRAGPIRAVLVVKTDLERMPEVRIDCYATVR